MNKAQILALKPGDPVMHKRYGLSKVLEVATCGNDVFGVGITPDNEVGIQLLKSDSHSVVPNFMEDNMRYIKPVVPKSKRP